MPILDRRRQQGCPERRVADDEQNLPPHEPLACPLTNEGKRAIAELANTRDVHRYQYHMKHSINHLSQGVMEINDATRDRHDFLARIVAKRQDSDSQEKTEREVETEKHLAALEAETPVISAEAEVAMRDLVDRQAQLDDDKAALAATVDYFQTLPVVPPSRPRRGQHTSDEEGGGEEGEEEEEDTETAAGPKQSVIDTLRQHRNEKQREYESLSAYQRYALNNDYAGFKKLWHESFHGETGPPVPNAKRWFDDAGNPVIPRSSAGRDISNEDGEADDANEDDDLIIAAEVRDYRCPLSMQEFKEPFSNRVCNHTYEKKWLVDWLQNVQGRRRTCVVAGCSKVFSLDDFYDDGAILRKMKRAQELQRLAQQDGSSSSSSSADEDKDVLRWVKQDRRSKNRKRKVDTVDDDNDDE